MNHQELAADASKAIPTVAVAATGAMGAVNWSTVTYMLTALYTLLLIGQFFYRMYKAWRFKQAVMAPVGSDKA